MVFLDGSSPFGILLVIHMGLLLMPEGLHRLDPVSRRVEKQINIYIYKIENGYVRIDRRKDVFKAMNQRERHREFKVSEVVMTACTCVLVHPRCC